MTSEDFLILFIIILNRLIPIVRDMKFDKEWLALGRPSIKTLTTDKTNIVTMDSPFKPIAYTLSLRFTLTLRSSVFFYIF